MCVLITGVSFYGGVPLYIHAKHISSVTLLSYTRTHTKLEDTDFGVGRSWVWRLYPGTTDVLEVEGGLEPSGIFGPPGSEGSGEQGGRYRRRSDESRISYIRSLSWTPNCTQIKSTGKIVCTCRGGLG